MTADKPKPRFQNIPKFLHGGSYAVDVEAGYLRQWLGGVLKIEGEKLDLDPDFQRGHVWTQDQQSRYIEYLIRGGQGSRTLYWNHPCWTGLGRGKNCDLPNDLVIVDGKQRLTAVLDFLDDKVPVFGYVLSEWADPHAVIKRHSGIAFKMHVNNLQTRAQLLQWYLDLNSGGTIHTSEEIDRVRSLLDRELEGAVQDDL